MSNLKKVSTPHSVQNEKYCILLTSLDLNMCSFLVLILFCTNTDYISCYVIGSSQSNTKSFWNISSVKSSALVSSDQIIPKNGLNQTLK